jgi:hypothetical protein
LTLQPTKKPRNRWLKLGRSFGVLTPTWLSVNLLSGIIAVVACGKNVIGSVHSMPHPMATNFQHSRISKYRWFNTFGSTSTNDISKKWHIHGIPPMFHVEHISHKK